MDNKKALWKLFEKTGLPEAFCAYKEEERKSVGGDKDEGDLPSRD